MINQVRVCTNFAQCKYILQILENNLQVNRSYEITIESKFFFASNFFKKDIKYIFKARNVVCREF